MLHLIQDGQVAYQVLTGKIPKENEFDTQIRHPSSPDFTFLNIQAGEILVDVRQPELPDDYSGRDQSRFRWVSLSLFLKISTESETGNEQNGMVVHGFLRDKELNN